MDFREIGRIISDDLIALDYLWKKRGNTLCPCCGSSDFYSLGGAEYDVRSVEETSERSGNAIHDRSFPVALPHRVIRIIWFCQEGLSGCAAELQNNIESI